MRVERSDVVIIGGGPAGSTAATLLARYDRGRRVVVLEQSRFPRHHVGESTLPDMNPILAKMGVLDRIDSAGFLRKTGITYKWSAAKPPFSEVFSRGILDRLSPDGAPRLPDYAWQVDRSRYDAILLDHARDTGVDVRTGCRVDGVVRDGARVVGVDVVCAGERYRIESEVVVDCSGQARVLSRWLGLEKHEHALGDLAVYRYFSGFRWDESILGTTDASRIFFSATPAGWMWLIPLSERDASVGLVTRRSFLQQHGAARLFDRELGCVPELLRMLEGAVPRGAPGDDSAPRTMTIADWSYNHERPFGPGYYLAGDAAAFVDPILSSGILLAHHSGLSVANAIHTRACGAEIEEGELGEGYARFHADLYGGFLTMARWWYERREVAGVDEWLRTAAELGRSARGSAAIDRDDVSAFMTFAAGYLTDFRFVHFGCGFGDAGLAETLSGLEGDRPLGDRVRREIADRSVRMRRKFERFEVEAYLATDVDSDRWWQLPAVRFVGPFGERTFRPPIPNEERHGGAAPLTLRILDRLLSSCDGTRTVEQIVRATRDAFDREHAQRTQRTANLLLADLVLLEVVAPE